MARKRDEAIKANLAGWLDDAAAAEAADTSPAAGPGPAGPLTTPAAAPAQGAFPGGRRMVTAYLDASEAAALEARAAADDRSVSYVVRAAVRAYLGLS